ncbi:MAG: NADH-quinone oxidoreductase subunit NuoG [Chloroflexi bacterium]|nr:NADH-quinone oxidoreductase subunit NuoG [Chloroflexota bacterium]
MDNLVTLTVNGKTVRVPRGTLLVDAAKTVGVHIPVFCYHEKMKPVGACRMCMVEIAPGPPLPQTACTSPVAEGMVVKTTSPMAVSAQKSTIEFLLLNHPLDCPVCDRGGECPLQDNTFGFGGAESRYIDEKRHFEKPLVLSDEVLLDRERCIMCYRCVRFAREIAGDESLTVIERGTESQIGLAPGRTFDSPFSGNTIEICPVGALTSARYRFSARPWDIRSVSTICPHCAVGCNVRADVRDNQIKRFLSRENLTVDDGWLCDRGRFGYGYPYTSGRLTRPRLRRGSGLTDATWGEAIDTVAAAVRGAIDRRGPGSIAGLAGTGLTNEDLLAFRRLVVDTIGSGNLDHSRAAHPTSPLGIDAVTGSIQGLDRSDVILIVDANTLIDQPVLNLRIKKALGRGAQVVVVGSEPLDVNRSPYRQPFIAAGDDLGGVLEAIARLLPAEFDAARARRHEAAESNATRAFADTVKRAHDAAVAKAKEASEAEPAAYATVEEGATRYGITRATVAPIPARRVRGIEAFAAEAGADPISPAVVAAARTIGGAERLSILYPRSVGADPRVLNAVTNIGLLCEAFGREGAGIFPLVTGPNEQGAIDIGVVPGEGGVSGSAIAGAIESGKIEILFVVGRPLEADLLALRGRIPCLVVIDSLLGPTADAADVALPGLTFAEKDGTFTNLERRIQRMRACTTFPGDGRPEWRILRDLANAIGGAYTESNSEAMAAALAREVPHYAGVTLDRVGYRGIQWPVGPEGRGSPVLHAGSTFDLLPVGSA